jgi:pimeloyl-ACP methyl ester carboxylesterase
MATLSLSMGPVEYGDTGGDGSAVVLLHGLLMDGTVYDEVVEELRADIRCITPTLPLGAHRKPMRADADLSLRGLGRLVAEFLERLDLREATVCFNDWGGAQTIIADGLAGRIRRLVLVSCEAFENYPPGIPGKLASLSARMSGGLQLTRRVLLTRRLRQQPLALGWMAKREIPQERFERWMEPLKEPQIRRDLRKYAGGARHGRRVMSAATASLGTYTRPVLILWAADDRLMPVEHGSRLAAAFPNSELHQIPDSYTLVPVDQPVLLAGHLRRFVTEVN